MIGAPSIRYATKVTTRDTDYNELSEYFSLFSFCDSGVPKEKLSSCESNDPRVTKEKLPSSKSNPVNLKFVRKIFVRNFFIRKFQVRFESKIKVKIKF